MFRTHDRHNVLSPSAIFFAIALAASVGTVSRAGANPNGDWHTFDVAPVPRILPLAAYDPISDRMFVYSGRSYWDSAYSDAWWLTLRGTPDWVHIATPESPPGRGSAYAFDSARNRVVAFGGQDKSSTWIATTWSHALGGTAAWSQQPASGTLPTPRSEASGIYDSARDRFVVFAGFSASAYLSDVAALDLTTDTWSPITPEGLPPGERSEHVAIYDPVRDRMIVFGGRRNSTPLSDLWTLDFAPSPQWTRILPSGPTPSARIGATAIYDGARDRMILFGGSNEADTWALSLSDFSWSQLSTGPGPSGRSNAAAVLDPVADRMIVFGGGPDLLGLSDCWALSLSGTPAWSVLHVGRPGTGTGHSAIRVPSTDQMIIFGGASYGAFVTYGNYNDVVAFNLATENWTLLTPSGTPPTPRTGHSAIYDPISHRMLVHGGGSSELWSLTLGGTPAWALLTPSGTSPGVRNNHSTIFDPLRNRMLLYGGGGAEVYALSLTGPLQWQQLVAAGPSPGERSGHVATYDPVRDRMIVFGGSNSQTWALSLSGTPTWAQIPADGSIPPDYIDCVGVYDSYRDRLVIFGGRSTNYQQNRTFVLPLNGVPTWTQLTPTGTSFGSSSGAGIYDPIRDRLVIHGGQYDGGVTTHFTSNTTYELVWGDVTSVPSPAGPRSGATISLVRPNPSSGIQVFEIELASDLASGSFEIFSVTGQRVWSEKLKGLAPGRHVIEWNGRTRNNRAVPAGVYLARLDARPSTASRRFLRVP